LAVDPLEFVQSQVRTSIAPAEYNPPTWLKQDVSSIHVGWRLGANPRPSCSIEVNLEQPDRTHSTTVFFFSCPFFKLTNHIRRTTIKTVERHSIWYKMRIGQKSSGRKSMGRKSIGRNERGRNNFGTKREGTKWTGQSERGTKWIGRNVGGRKVGDKMNGHQLFEPW